MILSQATMIQSVFLANVYLFKMNNKNTRRRYEISQQGKHQKDVIDVVLLFLLLTWNIFHTFS